MFLLSLQWLHIFLAGPVLLDDAVLLVHDVDLHGLHLAIRVVPRIQLTRQGGVPNGRVPGGSGTACTLCMQFLSFAYCFSVPLFLCKYETLMNPQGRCFFFTFVFRTPV